MKLVKQNSVWIQAELTLHWSDSTLVLGSFCVMSNAQTKDDLYTNVRMEVQDILYF